MARLKKGETMATYVISDIHGQLDSLNKMFELIKFSDDDHLYVLGDVVDRGDYSLKTLLMLNEMENVTIFKGNHEQMMEEYFEDSRDDNWLYNGGNMTYNEYVNLDLDKQKKVLNIIKKLRCYKHVGINGNNFTLVHAGMECDSKGDIKGIQDQDYMTWARREFYRDTYVNDKQTIIFGHTPVSNIHNKWKIWHGTNKICIDCGCAYGGKLACLRLNDMEEYYI